MTEAEKTDLILEIPVDRIKPNRFQPRQPDTDEDLAELAASIKEQGELIQPIVVRKEGGFYEIAAGERRWRACMQLGRKTIPAIIRELNDEQMALMVIVENLQRKDLNPVEEASGYRRLQVTFGWTQQQIAEKVSKTRDHIAQRLRLLGFPRCLQEAVSRDTISQSHAELLASLRDRVLIESTLHAVVDRGLSTRETEALVDGLLRQREETSRRTPLLSEEPERKSPNSEKSSEDMRFELEADLVAMRSLPKREPDRRKPRTSPQQDREEEDEEEQDERETHEDLPPGTTLWEIKGVPIDRRIQLNPKLLLMFDWFREKYNYQGDISDFLNDAVEDFFKSRGYEVEIVKREHVR